MSHDLKTAAAKRQAGREFLTSHTRSSQHEIRDVDATDQQHQRGTAPQEIECRTNISHKDFPEISNLGVKSGVNRECLHLRKSFDIRGGEGVYSRLRLFESCARFQPRD